MSMAKWRELPFTQAVKDVTSKANKVNQDRFQISGEYPIIDQGSNFIAGYIDDESLVWKGELPVIIFGDHTRALKYVDFPFVLGADGAKVLQPIRDIWPQFAYFAILELDIPSAGYSRHFKFLKETLVRFPPLPEQKRIAVILAKADRLRRLRRHARDLSDTYLQSVFLEMFGDPVSNPMGWDRAKVSDLGTVQTGSTPPRNDLENYGDYIEWIKSDNIIPGQMFVSRSLEMLSDKGLERGRSVEAGSILVTCIAGSPTSIGNVALTDRRVSFNQQINAVTPDEDIEPLFLYGLFVVAKPLVQRSTTLAMKRMISKSKFEKLVLIKPPLHLQKRFARVVRKLERLRAQQREAERQAEHLFQTLLHRAFRGEV